LSVVVVIAAHTPSVSATQVVAVFLGVQSVFDASSLNGQTDGKQHIQVHRFGFIQFCFTAFLTFVMIKYCAVMFYFHSDLAISSCV